MISTKGELSVNNQYAQQALAQASYQGQAAGQVPGGYVVGAAVQVDQQTTVMSAAAMELDQAIALAGRNTQLLREMKERLFGQYPDKMANAPTPRPVPNGSVQLVGEKVEILKAILRDQQSLVDELQKVG